MKIGIITQARTTSTRLPGKVLLKINEKTLLEYHLQRLKESGLEVFVATTTNNEDDPIVDIAEQNKFKYYRGSELDVLKRYYECAELYELDVIIRATSDCPLIDADLINTGLSLYMKINEDHAFVSNSRERTYPKGFDFSIFSFPQLKNANEKANINYHREHVTPYIIAQKKTTFCHVKRSKDASNFRITVDTYEDFKLIKKLISDFQCQNMNAEGIIQVLENLKNNTDQGD